jgi:fructose-1,6-bisphosphatase/inositol monophosphatase family enzyme
LNGKPASVSATQKLDEALLLCTDFPACERYGLGDVTRALQSKTKSSRTWGDCYGYDLVATGRADVMLDPVMNVWDCAALLPIMEEAGGTFTDWRGIGTASGGNAIATNGLLFEEVMNVVRQN